MTAACRPLGTSTPRRSLYASHSLTVRRSWAEDPSAAENAVEEPTARRNTRRAHERIYSSRSGRAVRLAQARRGCPASSGEKGLSG
jgi:hypothetical protein